MMTRISSKVSLGYMLVLILAASKLALSTLEPITGTSKIASGEGIVHEGNCRYSGLGEAEMGQGKEYWHDQNAQKKIARSLSGDRARIDSMDSDWQKVTWKVVTLIWAYDKQDHISGPVKDLERIHDHLLTKSEEVASALSIPVSKDGSQGRSRVPARMPQSFRYRPHILTKDMENITPFSLEHTWFELEKMVIEPHGILHDDKNQFKVGLLESMLMIGNYIAKYQLMPVGFLEGVQLFRPKVLSELLQFYLKRKQWNSERLLDDFDWNTVVPTLECLTRHKMVEPFHRPIRALDHQGKKLVVNDSLKTFMEVLKEKTQKGFDDEFTEIVESFFGGNLSEDVLSSTKSLDIGPDDKEINTIEDQRPSSALQYAMKQVENPPNVSEGEKFRNQFVFSCSLIEYFKSFDRDTIAKMSQGGIDLTAFNRKYTFIHDTFRMIRTTAQPWHMMRFKYMQLIMDQDQDEEMRAWIKRFTEVMFGESKTNEIQSLLEKLTKSKLKASEMKFKL
ncbi:hypothetical protein PGT21_031095 [Puccinia graminis f. sp. tritici]|uniref:Uncharacterized protein n=1 Tax=Puccinia graminis f. sp. tritici TaxID=56615 RepID=A0A5B0Q3S0_PUCGR|nr:hypothetical protein PGT21_031095 [Puccinia graminis f. sp. tritici]KAA1107960.1 hypothetical protein PGTUg99_016890 [Puccinia graminis f. sp. tritici]